MADMYTVALDSAGFKPYAGEKEFSLARVTQFAAKGETLGLEGSGATYIVPQSELDRLGKAGAFSDYETDGKVVLPANATAAHPSVTKPGGGPTDEPTDPPDSAGTPLRGDAEPPHIGTNDSSTAGTVEPLEGDAAAEFDELMALDPEPLQDRATALGVDIGPNDSKSDVARKIVLRGQELAEAAAKDTGEKLPPEIPS